MKILLLNPPRRDGVVMVKEGRCMQRKGAWGYVMAPVTMVTIATHLRDGGHQVSVMDCAADGTSFDAMVAEVARRAPGLVLVNTATPSIDDDAAAAAAVRAAVSPAPFTALYGIHPSTEHRALLRPGGGVDACLIGEPEATARELADALAAGAPPQGVAGLALAAAGGAPLLTPPRDPIADLDALPIPDWSLVDLDRYRLPLSGERFLLVATNRGCPYRCSFCNAHVYYGRAPRRRSAASVVAELRRDVEVHGVRQFMFWAEEFLSDREGVLALCRAIREAGLDVRWVCNSRVDAVDPALLEAIREAGCWNVAFGIESGDPAVLRAAHKGIQPDQARRAVAMARAAGLQVTGHVIVGFPGETREGIEATGRFVDGLDLDFVQYYCAMPYPGTELHARAAAEGLLVPAPWSAWEHNQSVLSTGPLSPEEVMRLRRRLMLRWYLTPRRVLRTARHHVRTPAHLWAALRSAAGFLRWM